MLWELVGDFVDSDAQSRICRTTSTMGVSTQDVLEVVGLAVALAVLLCISFVLSENGMFAPLRPATTHFPPLLVAVRTVPRGSSAAECMAEVHADLLAKYLMPRRTPSTALPVHEHPSAGNDSADSGAELLVAPEAGDMFTVHFGATRSGEAGATAASAGVVLAVGESATSAGLAAWRKKLAKVLGVEVEMVDVEGKGLRVEFPWKGRLSDMLARRRVFRKLALYLNKELRNRPQIAPCFLQVYSSSQQCRIIHIPIAPALRELRRKHGLTLRPVPS